MKYKVVKVFRGSSRQTVLRRHLTEADAQAVVKQYKATSRSMVVYFKES